MAGHVQKQPASQKAWAPEPTKREPGYLKRVEEKKKQKPKTAPAGGGMKPPSKPPKGPTGGDNKGPKNPKDIGKGNNPDYNPHSNKPKPKKPEPQSPKNPKGSQFPDDRDLRQRKREGQKPHDYKKPDVKITRDQQGHSSSMNGFKKSTKKDK
jgi:hypothetical protein